MYSVIVRTLDNETKRKIAAAGMVSTLLAVSLVTMLGFLTGAFYDSPTVYPNETTYRIDHVVSGKFADFTPFEQTFTPNAPIYSVNPGLTNIVNLGDFPTLPADVSQMLIDNGFAVLPQCKYKHIHEILVLNDDRGVPSFVSSDAVLHAYHVLYDLALREIEVYSFWDLLGNLTDALLDVTFNQYSIAPECRWKDAALRNLMFFSVAMKLIDNEWVIPAAFPSEVSPAVDTVLLLIENHSVMTFAWFMNYLEDFTQFVPRGHYTRSETLQRYFQAMMWYGRVSFRLQPEAPPAPNEKGKDNTAQAILISLALTEEVPGLFGSLVGLDVWDALYEPTAFFVGAADDLTPTEYVALIQSVYGSEVTISDLNNESLLEQFIDDALELREPLILGHPISDAEELIQTMGFRFMGQRYIPDSYILSQLVYDNVGTMLNPRLMPMGLDVMAAFGSSRAWELLDDEKDYLNYVSQMEILWEQIGNMTEFEWTQNLYYLWLYSLLPLLSDPSEGYPFFMQSDAWVDKQLFTALASWTELRHDTILYAKQSYGSYTSLPPQVRGYVEPVPNLYARLASLCQMMITGLDSRGLLSSLIGLKLEKLRDFLLDLQTISIKELEGTPLTDSEYQVIQNSGSILERTVTFPSDTQITSDADKDMAVIADVHTDPITARVLEEAVGRPMVILVAVEIEGSVTLTRGAVFSYYEFAWPMGDRLTDEAWQDMIDQGEEPSLPSWTNSFVVDWDFEFNAATILLSKEKSCI
ncbi:MAG: DUF3160 domain-containing protein [Candidatus Thorarchaeota archaeon SMTZ1-45]|nr:MAG: hypothetical protein AM325_16010 [Candidatus Thorarchaeota archaeon SMTZ1-45]